MKNLSLISLLFLLLFSACKKDNPDVDNPIEETNNPIENWNPIVANVNASLTGQVIDQSGAPIPEAIITHENQTRTTNEFGFFFFNNTIMNSKGAYIKVEKEGYFLGSRRFFPKANIQNSVKICLLKKTFDQSFSTDSESILEFEGASVSFPPNSIANENGEAYVGNVNFAAKWLDPSSTNTFLEMPGNLQGVDSESEEVALQTLGMIVVELEDNEGNELNILAGNTATINIPVPEDLRANAPQEIPLWSFNEEYGMWIEEAKARLQNDVYIGEVAHFSFWNCDIPTDYVNFSVQFNTNNGSPFVEGYVVLYSEGFGTAYGNLDINGEVSGIIPANVSLEMKVFHNACYDLPILEQTVGPFSEDTNIGTITLDNQTSYATITGSLVDCMDEPIQNGYLKFENDDQCTYHPLTSADFDYTYTNCEGNPVTVTAIDLDNNVAGEPVDIVLGEVNNLGDLSVCSEELNVDFVRFEVNGISKNYLITNVAQVENDSTAFSSVTESLNIYIYVRFAGSQAGAYPDEENFYYLYDPVQSWSFDSDMFSEFNVAEEANGKLSGTMSGEFYNASTGQTELLEGEFLITPPE